MINRITVLALLLVIALTLPSKAEDLKTTRIALFSSGVGYFESAMSVEGNTVAELKFRVDQINDVLKSLVLRDLNGGAISIVNYPSRDPVEKALKSFAVDITGKPTFGELLAQLRGVMVEVKAPSPVTGAILGIERQRFNLEGKTTIEKDVLTLLTAEGLRSFVLPEVASVRILDAKLEGELRKALETLATSHDSEKKTVMVNFTGQGQRQVRAGYILETPVWKTSYRLELGTDKKPYLQGWAIVENATEQDWENVRLSLVAGRPISFRMDLYQPLYAQRPEEKLALYESLRPPSYETEVTGLFYRQGGMAKAAPAAQAPSRHILASISHDAAMPAEEAAELESSGVASLALAQEAGELFEYSIQTPVSLKRQQSAMLPIVTGEVQGQKVSIYNRTTHLKHPLNGLKLKNTTALHLMQGPVTVFDGGIYAGDAKLPDLQPNEERMLAYALDLAVEVDVKQQPIPEQVTKLWIAKGTLGMQRKLVDEKEYTITNKNQVPRTVIVEHLTAPDWILVEPKEAEEQTSSLLRFKVEVPNQKTRKLLVKTEKAVDEWVALTDMNVDQIGIYLRQPSISKKLQQALNRLIQLRQELDQTRRQLAETDKSINAIAEEQKRLRENMRVLSQTSDVYKRYEQKFDAQETQVEELRKQADTLQKQEEVQRNALEEFILSINVE